MNINKVPGIPILPGGHFLRESDFQSEQWKALIDFAAQVKAEKNEGREQPRLVGKNIALIFTKTSTRTRCSMEIAAADQGAHTTYLDPTGSQLGHKESVSDTARVLGRLFDGLVYRGDDQSELNIFAQKSGIPVINALTDQWHPTQMLADSLTMREHSVGREYGDISYAYIGDARFNMGCSLLINGALLGMDVRIIAPPQLQPDANVIASAQKIAALTGSRVTVTDDPEAVKGVNFVHTDIWVSMGEPVEVWEERIKFLAPYRVDMQLMEIAGPNAKFMHCLPAFHDLNTKIGRTINEKYGLDGIEVSDEVFESERSIVFDQAGNRMPTIKAVLVSALANA